MLGTQRTKTRSDELSIVQALARGDESAITAFYETHADTVFRFVYRRVGERREDAEEITHDTFLSALQLAPTFDGSCSAFTWLCGIAKLRLIDAHRRESRDKRIPADKVESLDDDTLAALRDFDAESSSLDDVLGRLDTSRMVDAMLAPLTADEREALLLRYAEQLSVREMTHVMQRTEKAIEGLLDRAKKKAARAAAEMI